MTDYGDGIFGVDAGFTGPGRALVCIVVDSGRAVIVETAHSGALAPVQQALAELGVARENVDFIFLTHVHLDHAGGAGVFMEAFSNAKLVVHPRGARHMINPDKLIAGASEVYGADEVRRVYGAITPVPKSRVIAPEDGAIIPLAGRSFKCLHTPGHAKHHISYIESASRSLFAGDAFGLSYPKMTTENGRWAVPTTSPIQFDPEAMCSSIDKIIGEKPSRIFLTHFGELGNAEEAAGGLKRQIDEYMRVARESLGNKDELKKSLGELLKKEAAKNGWSGTEAELFEIMGGDHQLNAQGLCHWIATA